MYTKEEIRILKSLNTPSKIQDFVTNLKTNFEVDGKDTCVSPRKVLRTKSAHCIEAAIFAAAALKFHGHKPLLVDLESSDDDWDHVVAVFKQKGFWGAISKSNHDCLRYREPIFKNIRELVLSFFHEYVLNSNGEKTLRRYSKPVNLNRFKEKDWIFSEKDIWIVPEHLVETKHHPILEKWQVKNLRKADPIELKCGKITWEKDPVKRKDGW